MSSVPRYTLPQGAKTLRRISMQPMEDPRAEKAVLLAVGYLGNLVGSPPVTHPDV